MSSFYKEQMHIREKLAGLKALMGFDNWPVLIFARTFDRRTGLVTYRKGGMVILVDHHGGDENGTRTCLTSDMYQKHLRRMAVTGPLRVLDLGANGGGFPLLLLMSGFQVEKAVCVEMNPSTALRLQINLDTNFNGRAIGLNAAVCGLNAEKEILLERSRGSTGLSMEANRASMADSCVSVPAITVSELFDRYFPDVRVDICKIDIEGAEYDVLGDTPDALLSRIRNLMIEFHKPERNPALVKRLQEIGFVESTPDADAKTGENTEVRFFRNTS